VRLFQIVRNLCARVNTALTRQGAAPILQPSPLIISDQYVKLAQNALDIFQGEWSSQLPEPLTGLTAGSLGLFDDIRIKWFTEKIGGVTQKSVLELGPLEAGHSYMLEKLGAAHVTSVEANTRAYLKCLIVKELLGLQRISFLCGDFVEYLRRDGPQFDVCVASGVLYHMQNPAELIALIARRCTGHVFLWTHYYDRATISANPALAEKFTDTTVSECAGFRHELYRYEYQDALQWSGFCGGNAPFSYWMTRESIIECLRFFGFYDLRVGFDDRYHLHGPAFAIVAKQQFKPNLASVL
jgi:hypothetical protein